MSDSVDPLLLHDARPEDGETHRLLGAVLARLDRIESLLAERERLQRPALSRLHERVAVPLIGEISNAVGDSIWTCRQLFDFAADDPQLRRALTAAVGSFDVGASRRLGNLMSRCENVTLPNGCRVERVSADGDCSEWRVVRI